jgi:hypothetical protein
MEAIAPIFGLRLEAPISMKNRANYPGRVRKGHRRLTIFVWLCILGSLYGLCPVGVGHPDNRNLLVKSITRRSYYR